MGSRDVTIYRSTSTGEERARIARDLRELAEALETGRAEAELTVETERDLLGAALCLTYALAAKSAASIRMRLGAVTTAAASMRIGPTPVHPLGDD